MTDKNHSDDRFGTAESDIIKAIEEHRGLIRAGCYVPTRQEVATNDATWLASVLIDWW